MASGTLLALRWATNSEAPGLDLQVGSKEGRWASSSATNSLQRLRLKENWNWWGTTTTMATWNDTAKKLNNGDVGTGDGICLKTRMYLCVQVGGKKLT